MEEKEDSDVRAAADEDEDARHTCTWMQQCDGWMIFAHVCMYPDLFGAMAMSHKRHYSGSNGQATPSMATWQHIIPQLLAGVEPDLDHTPG